MGLSHSRGTGMDADPCRITCITTAQADVQGKWYLNITLKGGVGRLNSSVHKNVVSRFNRVQFYPGQGNTDLSWRK